MPLHGLGVNSIDGKPLVEQRTNERTMRRREGDEDVVRRLDPCTDSGYELIQALRRVLYRPPSPAWCRRHPLNNTRGAYRPNRFRPATPAPTSPSHTCVVATPRHHQQPPMGPAFETHLSTGGQMPHMAGER